MTGQVFISYTRADRAYVDKLAAVLAAEGIPLWYDYEIATGDRFEKIIKRQIDACAAFVVVMTPESDESEWVNVEVNYARHRGKPVLPLLLSGEVFMRLNILDYADVRGGTLPGRHFLDHLRQLVAAATPQHVDPVPPTPAVVRTPSVAVAEAGELVRTISAKVDSLTFSPNGRLLVTHTMNGIITFDAATGVNAASLNFSGSAPGRTRQFAWGTGPIPIAWSPDGENLFSAGLSGMWNPHTGEEGLRIPAAAEAVAWSPDGRQLATADANGAKTWDAMSGAPRLTFATAAASVAFSPDGRQLAVGGAGGVDVWNTSTGAKINNVPNHGFVVYLVAYSPDRTRLAIVSYGHPDSNNGGYRLQYLALPSGTLSQEVRLGGPAVFSPHWHEIAIAVYTPGGAGHAEVRDAASGEIRFVFEGHGGVVTSIAFSPDGQVLATACLDGVIRLWQL